MTVLWYFHFYFATIQSLRIVRGTLYFLYFGADKARPKRVLSYFLLGSTLQYTRKYSVLVLFGRTPGRRALRGLALSEGSSGPEPFLANKTNYMR